MKIDGLPVVDAKRPLILTITAGDIKKATPGDPSCCAAAKALERQDGVKGARVHMGRVYVLTGKKWHRYETPASMRSEIIAFDRRTSFMPGLYKLGAISPSQHTGKQQGSKTNQTRAKSAPTHGVYKRMKPHFVKDVRVRMAEFTTKTSAK